MNIKVIAVLLAVLIASFSECFAFSQMTPIAEENFAAEQDGAVPSTDWVVDFAAGCEVKGGALSISGKDKPAGAAYEIPAKVQEHMKEDIFRITAKVKVSGTDCRIPYVTDYQGRVICGIDGESIDNTDWNEVVLEASPYDKTFSVYVNGEMITENAAYYNSNASGAAVIRFSTSGDAEVLVQSMKIETADADAEAVRNTDFADVSANSWARKYILRLASEGIMVGTGENTFSPKSLMTSGQTAVIMCRIFNIPTDSGEEWYSGAVSALAERGVMQADAEDVPLMRKDICVMAATLLKQSGIKADGLVMGKFVDTDTLTDEERESVLMLAALSVINGVSETEFAPFEYVTREQAAKIFSSLMGVVS